MERGKAVYCQKPLTHHVSEAREMDKVAKQKGLVTQMGIQVHSFYDYKLTLLLFNQILLERSNECMLGRLGIGDMMDRCLLKPVKYLNYFNWNLWLGTAKERPYTEGVYHPGNWRKLIDYGCGTLGDMGVHIFDTPYNALGLDVPETIKNICREPNDFSFPENNVVKYEFLGTNYTTKKFEWIWYDGPGAPKDHKDLILPDNDKLPEQGAMFVGEKGRLLLPHFMPSKVHFKG